MQHHVPVILDREFAFGAQVRLASMGISMYRMHQDEIMVQYVTYLLTEWSDHRIFYALILLFLGEMDSNLKPQSVLSLLLSMPCAAEILLVRNIIYLISNI